MSNMPTSCPGCGQPFDASRATYDRNGNLQCSNCAARSQIAQGDARAADSLYGVAGGILGGGIVSLFCFNPFGLLSLATAISGVGWIATVSGNGSHRQTLGPKYGSAMAMVGIGTGLAFLALTAFALKTAGFLLFR